MGRTQKQADNELRKIVQGVEVLLRRRHDIQSARQAIRVQVRLRFKATFRV